MLAMLDLIRVGCTAWGTRLKELTAIVAESRRD
jgi:hypothetical protein